jgi:hypothetical protein
MILAGVLVVIGLQIWSVFRDRAARAFWRGNGATTIDLKAKQIRNNKDVYLKNHLREDLVFALRVYGTSSEDAVFARMIVSELLTPGQSTVHPDAAIGIFIKNRLVKIIVIEFQSKAEDFDIVRFMDCGYLLAVKHSREEHSYIPVTVKTVYSASAGLQARDFFAEDCSIGFKLEQHFLLQKDALTRALSEFGERIRNWAPLPDNGPGSPHKLPLDGIEIAGAYLIPLRLPRAESDENVTEFLGMWKDLAVKAGEPRMLAKMVGGFVAAKTASENVLESFKKETLDMGYDYKIFINEMTNGDYFKSLDELKAVADAANARADAAAAVAVREVAEAKAEAKAEAEARAEAEAKAKAEADAKVETILNAMARVLDSVGKSPEEIGAMLALSPDEVHRILGK